MVSEVVVTTVRLVIVPFSLIVCRRTTTTISVSSVLNIFYFDLGLLWQGPTYTTHHNPLSDLKFSCLIQPKYRAGLNFVLGVETSDRPLGTTDYLGTEIPTIFPVLERESAVHRAMLHCPVCTFWNFRLDSLDCIAYIVLLNIQIWDIYNLLLR